MGLNLRKNLTINKQRYTTNSCFQHIYNLNIDSIMKKIFTLLAFLVITVNAAAQYTGRCLNVGDQNDVNNYGFKSKPQISGQRGTVEGDRLNVSGYYFYKPF